MFYDTFICFIVHSHLIQFFSILALDTLTPTLGTAALNDNRKQSKDWSHWFSLQLPCPVCKSLMAALSRPASHPLLAVGDWATVIKKTCFSLNPLFNYRTQIQKLPITEHSSFFSPGTDVLLHKMLYFPELLNISIFLYKSWSRGQTAGKILFIHNNWMQKNEKGT